MDGAPDDLQPHAETVARDNFDTLAACAASTGFRVPYQSILTIPERTALERLMAERLIEAAPPEGIDHARFTVTPAGRMQLARIDAERAAADTAHDPVDPETRARWAAQVADMNRNADRIARPVLGRPATELALRRRDSDEVIALGVPWRRADTLPKAPRLPEKWRFALAPGDPDAVQLLGASDGVILLVRDRRFATHARHVNANTLPPGWEWAVHPAEPEPEPEPDDSLSAFYLGLDSEDGSLHAFYNVLEKEGARMARDPDDDNDYEPLARQLDAAFAQSATGKGRERHADGRRWTEQPIFVVAQQHGAGFLTGQAAKKLGEAAAMSRRGEHAKARHEILGAIVYAAAAAHQAEQDDET